MSRKAYEYALDLLSARAYTVRNLRARLIRKEFDGEEVTAAMERLVRAGLLDDMRYAREYAHQKLTRGGSSPRRVHGDLVRRGVAADEIRVAVETVMKEEGVDISLSVVLAARKKLASMGDLEPRVQRRRLFAFLVRRGFDIGEIRLAVDEGMRGR